MPYILRAIHSSVLSIRTTKGYSFPPQTWPIGVRNADGLCSLRGTNGILKYNFSLHCRSEIAGFSGKRSGFVPNQSASDVPCTKLNWGETLLHAHRFWIPPMDCTQFRLLVATTTRTKGRGQRKLKNQCSSKNREALDKNVLSLLLVFERSILKSYILFQTQFRLALQTEMRANSISTFVNNSAFHLVWMLKVLPYFAIIRSYMLYSTRICVSK
jgi:hypothetical protein